MQPDNGTIARQRQISAGNSASVFCHFLRLGKHSLAIGLFLGWVFIFRRRAVELIVQEPCTVLSQEHTQPIGFINIFNHLTDWKAGEARRLKDSTMESFLASAERAQRSPPSRSAQAGRT
jgi:hypothetical protein